MEYVIVAIFIVGVFTLLSSLNNLQSQVSRMNARLCKIAKQVGVEENIDSELQDLIAEGKKVEAVKRLREYSGVGLLEAKQYVDNLAK